MFVKTKFLHGKVVQYLGNIESLQKEFPILKFTFLKSYTTYNGKIILDCSVSDSNKTEDLIAGDFILRINDTWEILPLYEYEKYWVVDNVV